MHERTVNPLDICGAVCYTYTCTNADNTLRTIARQSVTVKGVFKMQKRNVTRAAAAVMTAAITLTSLCGCGKMGDLFNKGGSKKGGLDVSLDHSYSSEQLKLEQDNFMGDFLPVGDMLLMGGYEDGIQCFKVLDAVTGELKPIQLDFLKNGENDEYTYVNSVIPRSDGGLCFMVSGYKQSGDTDEDYSYEDLGMTLEIYDSSLNFVESREFDQSENSYSEIKPGPDNTYYATAWNDNSMELVVLDENFKQTGTISAPAQMSYVEDVFQTKNGDFIIAYQSDEKGGEQFGLIDTAAKAVTELQIDNMPLWFNRSFASKDDKYDFYLTDSTGIYGVNIANKTCEEAVNWINSDFTGDSISSVCQLSDGRFMVMDYVDNNSAASSNEIWILSPRDPSELKNTKLISMAVMYMPSNLAKAINRYNRSQNDYRIAVADYSKYNTEEDYSAGLTKLQNDMTSGIVADLVCVDGMPYESFCNKGLFLDLSDRVSGLSGDEYFTSYFDALRYGSKLYRMGFSFNVNTMIAKSSKVNGKTGISVTEFMDIVNGLPKDVAPFEDTTKDSALDILVKNNLNGFIDADAGTCTFDSPDFIKLLEMCNRFPAEGKDYSDMEESEWEKYWAEEAYQFINDKVIFRTLWIGDIRDAYREQYQYFDKESVTYTGFPMMVVSGNGGRFNPDFTMAVSANTDYPDQCWEFLSYMLSDEYQDSLGWTLPVKKSSFDKRAEDAKKPRTYMEDGQEVTYEDTLYRGDEEIKVPTVPQEYIDGLKDYISGINTTNYYDETVYNIVDEEIAKMSSGDQTAQQAAAQIQSRASLYLSEQH